MADITQSVQTVYTADDTAQEKTFARMRTRLNELMELNRKLAKSGGTNHDDGGAGGGGGGGNSRWSASAFAQRFDAGNARYLSRELVSLFGIRAVVGQITNAYERYNEQLAKALESNEKMEVSLAGQLSAAGRLEQGPQIEQALQGNRAASPDQLNKMFAALSKSAPRTASDRLTKIESALSPALVLGSDPALLGEIAGGLSQRRPKASAGEIADSTQYLLNHMSLAGARTVSSPGYHSEDMLRELQYPGYDEERKASKGYIKSQVALLAKTESGRTALEAQRKLVIQNQKTIPQQRQELNAQMDSEINAFWEREKARKGLGPVESVASDIALKAAKVGSYFSTFRTADTPSQDLFEREAPGEDGNPDYDATRRRVRQLRSDFNDKHVYGTAHEKEFQDAVREGLDLLRRIAHGSGSSSPQPPSEQH
ncbi:MAG TPA: hypothetical protein VFE24_00800 [Pirellulales bacterium]|jgi:hypothetical protein|nr:hypothetical protein [Pirellulales bacterium]